MPDGESLVAKAPEDPDGPGPITQGNGEYGWVGGIGIAESAMDTFNGIRSGSWVQAGLGMAGLAIEGAAAAIDPFGWLLSSVVSFLMEHVQPLKDMLDSVAGDPPVIRSYSQTWGNVSKHLARTEEDYTRSVEQAIREWAGPGAAAYRQHATEMTDALRGAASVCGSVSTVTMIFGEVVAFVRELVRDLIADLVGKLISWVLETVFSLGFGTPVVVAQAMAAIAKWASKIADLLRRLTRTIRKVSPLLADLAEVLGKVAKVFGKVAGKVTGVSPNNVRRGFVQRSGNGPDGPDGPGGLDGPGGRTGGDGPEGRTGGDRPEGVDDPDPNPATGTRASDEPDGGAPGTPGSRGDAPRVSRDSSASPAASDPGTSTPDGTRFDTTSSPTTHAPGNGPHAGPSGTPTPRGDTVSDSYSPSAGTPRSANPGPHPGTGTPDAPSTPPGPPPAGGPPGSPDSPALSGPLPHAQTSPALSTHAPDPAAGPGSPGSPGAPSAPDSPSRSADPAGPGATTAGSTTAPAAPTPSTLVPTPRSGEAPGAPGGTPVGGAPTGAGGGPSGAAARGDRPDAGRTGTPSRPAPTPHAPAPRGHVASPSGPNGSPPHTGPHQHGPDGRPNEHHPPDQPSPDRDPLSPDEVNQRHGEQTPAGSSYHRGDPELGDLPHRVQPDPDGRYTVDVHVTPEGNARIGGRDYTPEQFADILRRNADYDGQPIRLIGCDAGSNDFARRLARELDTDVLAPNKPAWTDTNGRVFSSDYDIGPDGRSRPRIPPNGAWTVHGPDGTTRAAGPDAHPPGTAPADQLDLDPEGARARGGTNDRDQVHRELIDKLNRGDKEAEELFKKHYYYRTLPDGRLSVSRKDKTMEYDGFTIPMLEVKDGKLGKQSIIESRYLDPAEQPAHLPLLGGGRESLARDDLWVADQLAAGRPGIQDNVVEAHAASKQDRHRDDILLPEGAGPRTSGDTAAPDPALFDVDPPAGASPRTSDHDFTPLDKDDHRAFSDLQSNHLGQGLGHAAAGHAFDDFRKAVDEAGLGPLVRLDLPDEGAGYLDTVWRYGSPPDYHYVIVEAKGPAADLSPSKGYEEGHPQYARDKFDEMEQRGRTAREQQEAGAAPLFRDSRWDEELAARELRQAMDDGRLRYVEVKALVGEPGAAGNPARDVWTSSRPSPHPDAIYLGYRAREFDLSID